MNAKTVLGAVVVLLGVTLLAAPSLQAADPGASDRAQRWEQHLQQKLGLTDDQLQAFRQLRASRDLEAERQQHRALRAAQTELRRLALNGADDATLAAKQAEIQTLLTRQLEQRVNTLRQIGPILNPDQREAFAKLMERGHRGHHRTPAPAPQG